MKKLFFFRSSSSSGNNNQSSPKDKEVYWETQPRNGISNRHSGENNFQSPGGPRSHKQASETQSSANSFGLRRSRSLSSAAFDDGRLGQMNFSCMSDRSGSPYSSTGMPTRRSSNSSRRHALTPEKQSKTKSFEMEAVHAYETERTSSAGSSLSSSNVLNKIVDRYIDGEEQQERSRLKDNTQRNPAGKVNGQSRRPPRVQYTAPTSPADSIRDKPKSHSFREVGGDRLKFSPRDWTESGIGHESPRRLAKNVIERLSQFHALPKTNRKSFESDIPITIEDIYVGSLNRSSRPISGGFGQKSCTMDEPYEAANGYYAEDFSSLQEENCFVSENSGGWETFEVADEKLRRKSKEAEERVMLLSQEIEQGSYLRDTEIDVQALIHKIRNLVDEKISLALEVSEILQCRITDQASAKEDIKLAKAELDSQTRRLEKEKNEIQSRLEKELDRRSSDWSLKVEKYQSEEQRLRERVRELAEQNVSLQRELSSYSEREIENRSMMTHSGQQLKDLSKRVEEVSEENQVLRQTLSELQDKYRAADQDRDCLHKHYKEKEKECQDLHKSITRLLRTCNEQEKTIGGLREGLNERTEKPSVEKVERHVKKMQLEQSRLAGVEQALRREVESYRLEVDSLRHENIDLLNRLKGYTKEGCFSTFKLDQELGARICFLQNQVLTLLNESTQHCSKLQEFIEGNKGLTTETQQDVNSVKHGLNRQLVIESDMKIQGFKRGIESLERSLQTMSALQHEKANLATFNLQSNCMEDTSKISLQTSEDFLRSELKAETLITSLLREKMYFKEQEVDQLRGELATAVRGNDILKSEVQNALDNLSCAAHKLKDFEIQMLKKDETISQIQSDLQQSSKELTIMRCILPKVSEERDMMWEEVKQYSEKNMLLDAEVNVLKKKIEALDEDILLKEGQITILKDTIARKPSDLFGSPVSSREFFVQ